VNCHGLHNRSESLIIIDAGTLHELTMNPMGLVPLECPIDLEFVLEDPIAGDNVGTMGSWNQVLSVVGHESDVLFLHSHPLMRISEGSPN
jgi:hypothetical protein